MQLLRALLRNAVMHVIITIACLHNNHNNAIQSYHFQENIISTVLQKPIMNLNTSDINQLRSILIGGIQNMNHTMRSLEQLNEIVGYFNQNETQVSMQVDNTDMNVSLAWSNQQNNRRKRTIIKIIDYDLYTCRGFTM